MILRSTRSIWMPCPAGSAVAPEREECHGKGRNQSRYPEDGAP
jgi:hypothetical protein